MQSILGHSIDMQTPTTQAAITINFEIILINYIGTNTSNLNSFRGVWLSTTTNSRVFINQLIESVEYCIHSAQQSLHNGRVVRKKVQPQVVQETDTCFPDLTSDLLNFCLYL